MKKNYLLALLMVFFCAISLVNATEVETGPFFFDWENEEREDGYESTILFGDNIGFKDGVVVFGTRQSTTNGTEIDITRYDKKGKILAEKTINGEMFYSVVTDNNHIYMITGIQATGANVAPNPIMFLYKLDENLEVVEELPFEYDTTPGYDGMINARIFGHDILAVTEEEVVVFCGEDYMLFTDLDLSEWIVKSYSDRKFATYFPDLSAEYELMYAWEEELYDYVGSRDIVLEVTTHVYDDYTLSSGAVFGSDYSMTGYIRLTDKDGKVIFEEETTTYEKFIEARVIGNYVVAIGLNKSALNYEYVEDQLENDIVVYNFDGEVVQTIETDGSYLLLNETESGFVANHIYECPIPPKSPRDAKAQAAGLCFNSEIYYLKLNVETKVEGKGNVEAVSDTRKGELVTFKVTPEKGYELVEVKVTDRRGNTVVFTDYTFTMPDSDVVIEATFRETENPNTVDIALTTIALLAIAGGIGYIALSKKLNWLK